MWDLIFKFISFRNLIILLTLSKYKLGKKYDRCTLDVKLHVDSDSELEYRPYHVVFSSISTKHAHSYALPWRPFPVLSALGMNKQKVYLYEGKGICERCSEAWGAHSTYPCVRPRRRSRRPRTRRAQEGTRCLKLMDLSTVWTFCRQYLSTYRYHF